VNFKAYKNRFGKQFIIEESVLNGFFAMRDGLSVDGIDIDVAQGWRGEAEQNAAKANGKSKAVWGKSPHNFGVSFDLMVAKKMGDPLGWPPETDPVWPVIGKVGKSAGLVWGGDFKSIHDVDHFELAGFESMNLTLYPDPPPLSA